jgi:hypothetical protein
MADMRPPRPVPDIDPVAAGARRDADLAEIEQALAAKNPHALDMALPRPLLDDGGLGS